MTAPQVVTVDFALARPELATDDSLARAGGSIGAVLGAGGEALTKARAAAGAFLDAVAGGPVPIAARALRQGPWQARGDFTTLLDAVAERLVSRAQRAITGGARVSPSAATGILAGVDRVLVARERAQGNVNPQLLLAVLADELAALEAA